MSWLSQLLSRLWDPVATTTGAVGMAVVGHLVRRFRERMVTLRWSVRHQSIAITTQDATFGKVEVLHNGRPAQNLTMCYVELENESTRDLTDVEFAVVYGDGTQFIVSVAALRGGKGLGFSPSYSAGINQFLAVPESQRAEKLAAYGFLGTSREYSVPVFNRGEKVDLAALVEVPPAVQPKAQLTCVHKGVRLRERPAQPTMFGVIQNHASAVGWVVGVLALLVLAGLGVIQFWPFFFAFLAGAMVLLIGAAAIWLMRLIVRIIG